MNEQKQQLVEKLKAANNILVTVRNNPNVDLLSACIGLTIMLNKLGKHATAVFSGEVPSTMEFLKPEDTIEKNTDSLRDFIIALDKSKADKLRYKVEDKTVRIFITPFKASISENDLEFSQGDFNVDVVIALGAHEQQELDHAITEHGRILHDAVVVSINNTENGSLGTINWQDRSASSISELVVELGKELGEDIMDEQVATALLTGIVAETDRFSNDKTTSETMNVSSRLLAAGANQQLVATKLKESVVAEQSPSVKDVPGDQRHDAARPPKPDDGTLEIEHESSKPPHQAEANKPSEPDVTSASENKDGLSAKKEPELPHISQPYPRRALLPAVPEPFPGGAGGTTPGTGFLEELSSSSLSNRANAEPEPLEKALDTLGGIGPVDKLPLLKHDYTPAAAEEPVSPVAPATPVFSQPAAPELPSTLAEPWSAGAPAVIEPVVAPLPGVDSDEETLSELEKAVHSQHVDEPAPDLDSARDEVLKALQETPAVAEEPIIALNAQPVDLNMHPNTPEVPTPPEAPAPITELHIDQEGNLQIPQLPLAAVNESAPNPLSPADQPMDMPLPPSINLPPPQSAPPTNTQNQNPNAPPPVPPPMMPPSY